MLFITEKAIEMIEQSASLNKKKGESLRIEAVSLPKGKYRFHMGFDLPQPEDTQWHCQETMVIVDPKSLPILEHMILDFQDIPGGGPQFAFVHAQEQAT